MNIGAYVAITIAILLSMLKTVSCSYCDDIALQNVTALNDKYKYDGEPNNYKMETNILVRGKLNPTSVDEGETVVIVCLYSMKNSSATFLEQSTKSKDVYYFIRLDCPKNITIQADDRNYYRISNVSIADKGTYKCIGSGLLGFVESGEPIKLNVTQKYFPTLAPPTPSPTPPTTLPPPTPPPRRHYEGNRIRHYAPGRARLSLHFTGQQTSYRDITVGSTVVLKCVIHLQDEIPLTSPFSLYFNGVPIIQNQAESFVNGAYFEIPRIKKSDAGNYSCLTQNRIGMVFSNSYELKVYDKLDIMACPRAGLWNPLNVTLKLNGSADAEQRINKHSKVIFTCEVSPKHTDVKILSLRWYIFNDTIRLNTSNGVHIIGSTLILNRIGFVEDGVYTCRIKTKDGVSCSNSIDLQVAELKIKDLQADIDQQQIMAKSKGTGLPRLQVQLRNRLEAGHVDAFEDIYLVCNVMSKKSLIREYAWFFRGLRLYTDEKSGIICNGTDLILRAIRIEGSGEYICQGQISNDTVAYSDPFLLRVKQPAGLHQCVKQTVAPKVLLYYGNDLEHGQYLDLGDRISLVCHVYTDMKSNISYRWFLNGREKIPDNYWRKTNGTTLELLSFEETDAGNYVCEAKTENGVAYSNSERIELIEYEYQGTNLYDNVQLAILLGETLDPDEIEESDTIYIICVVNLEIVDIEDIVWIHNNYELSPEYYPSYKFSFSTLVIQNITKSAAGKYKCKLESKKGYKYSRMPLEIKVKDKPRGGARYTSDTKTPDTWAEGEISGQYE